MKATVFFFHGANNKYEELTGYKHNQEVPVEDIYNVARDIFDLGLNVMLYHSGKDSIVIMVDDKRFQQR